MRLQHCVHMFLHTCAVCHTQSNVIILFPARWFSYRNAITLIEDHFRWTWTKASNLSVSAVDHIKTGIESQSRSESSRQIQVAVVRNHFNIHWRPWPITTVIQCSECAKVYVAIPPVYNFTAISCAAADNFFPIAYRRLWHTVQACQTIDLAVTCEIQNHDMVAMSQMVAMTSSTIYSLLVVSLEDLHHVMQMVCKIETCNLHGPFKEVFKNVQCTLPHGINLSD